MAGDYLPKIALLEHAFRERVATGSIPVGGLLRHYVDHYKI